MKKLLFTILLIHIVTLLCYCQNIDKIINVAEVERIEKILSADDMQGRKPFTPGIEKAAEFIATEFKKNGLLFFNDSHSYKQQLPESTLYNIIGLLPGKSKKDEYVLFSAHYDHIGIGKANARGDSIYNGANDNASGVTAIILLSRYFSRLKNNERSILFVAFTAEESGGLGSAHFSKCVDPNKIVAMFNIEMIGTESKWGRNSAYITGYEKSDMGKILQKNLTDSKFIFKPDPYPQQKLFYRSDNATLAALGVPAHTISTSKMDSEKYYHTPEDEIETLEIKNMAEIIKAIAISSQTIINGKDTPGRIEVLKKDGN